MKEAIRILKYSSILAFIALFTCTGCASAKKSKIHSIRKESLCDLTHLGKNKYFYSKYYERKIGRSERKISGR